MEKWLDREKIKSEISGWLASDMPHLLLITDDSQEFEDVTRWFESLEEFKVSIAYLNTDSEVMRFSLLEEVVDGFGRENFPKFNILHSEFSAIEPQLIIQQKMGTDINTTNLDFNTNTQNLTINNADPESIKAYNIENRIGEFLDSFLEDLSRIDSGYLNLIVCRFRGKGAGFNDLEPKFRNWFLDQFIRKIKSVSVKMIVVCQISAGELSYLFDNQFTLKKLYLDDILTVSENYLNDKEGYFCKGAVDEDKTIAYKDFRLKLRPYLPMGPENA